MARPSDIIVVGAGIVGAAVAYELARRGVEVRIVDERTVGMGATQASAGVLAPYIEAREDSAFLSLTVRSLELFDEFIPRVAAQSGIAVEYKRTGTIDVAVSDAEMRNLETTASVLWHSTWAIRSSRVGKCRYSVPIPTPARFAMSSSEASAPRSANCASAARISRS